VWFILDSWKICNKYRLAGIDRFRWKDGRFFIGNGDGRLEVDCLKHGDVLLTRDFPTCSNFTDKGLVSYHQVYVRGCVWQVYPLLLHLLEVKSYPKVSFAVYCYIFRLKVPVIQVEKPNPKPYYSFSQPIGADQKYFPTRVQFLCFNQHHHDQAVYWSHCQVHLFLYFDREMFLVFTLMWL